MPELPEVHTLVHDLIQQKIVGKKISAVKIFWRASIDHATNRDIKKYLIDKRIEDVKRRGKYIVMIFHNQSLILIHLRMSGRVRYCSSTEERSKHEHIILTLNNGFDLRFHDPRKFGRLYIGSKVKKRIETLGPEPLDPQFDALKLMKIIKKRKRVLKGLLLDQSFIAGLGNIYVDESLWESQLHPQRIAASLTKDEIIKLLKSIRKVLRQSIRNRGTSLGQGESNFASLNKRGRNQLALKVYQRGMQPCLRCKGLIVRMKVMQRGTYFCPFCQKR